MRLQSGSPLAILARGYAVIRTTAGELLRRSDQVQPGDPIAIRLAEGGLQAQVTQCEPVAEKGVGKR
jgi:exodeoxyribonuclease VII large subunit